MGKIAMRPATADDHSFALELCRRTMRPYIEPLFGWDEAAQMAIFDARFDAGRASVITFDGRDVGWLLILESEGSLYLSQLFIEPEFQNRGVSTAVLTRLAEEWRRDGKPVSLGVLKNNPARRLYERFGFVVDREDAHKLFMRLAR